MHTKSWAKATLVIKRYAIHLDFSFHVLSIDACLDAIPTCILIQEIQQTTQNFPMEVSKDHIILLPKTLANLNQYQTQN